MNEHANGGIALSLPEHRDRPEDPRRPDSARERPDRGAETLMGTVIERLANADDGNRNSTLFRSACAVGGLAAAGRIEESTAVEQLMAAAGSIGLDESEARSTIRSGVAKGRTSPLHSRQQPNGARTPAQRPVAHSAPRKPKPKAKPGPIWRNAVSADGTPAAAYLAGRCAWPPPDVPGYKPLPDSVRWIDRQRWPVNAGMFLPVDAAGAVLFRFADAKGNGQAVQCEALTANSQTLDPRWRRCAGSKQGAWMSVGAGGSPVVLVEGEADALAAVWLRPGCEARACGGTAGLQTGAAMPTDGRPCEIWPDGDAAGSGAITTPMRQTARIRWLTKGDPAEQLKRHIKTSTAALDGDLAEAGRQHINQQEIGGDADC